MAIREELRARFGPELDHANELIANARASNTLRAYQSTWKAFSAWCDDKIIDPWSATPEIVVVFLTYLAKEGLSPTSLVREYSAISFFLRPKRPETWPRRHRPYVIAEMLAGAFRTYGRPADKKRPLEAEHLYRLAALDYGTSLRARRDRALLLLGFTGAFRRSELVALDKEDVTSESRGLRVLLRRSKTDQEGRGFTKAIATNSDPSTCPVRALRTWIAAARIDAGPLFRRVRGGKVTAERLSDRMVALIVKDAIEALGLDSSAYAGHSLRCGFVTTAARGGASIPSIMNQTGHKSFEQVRGYIRYDDPFQDNASVGILSRKPARGPVRTCKHCGLSRSAHGPTLTCPV